MEPRIWVFLALMGAVAVTIPWAAAQARRRGGEQVRRSLETLAARGWVAESATTRNGRRLVRVWGRLPHAVSLDLRVARRARFWGAIARGSGGMLDPLFEDAFRIVTREPERARLVLEPEIQRRLLACGRVELRLGSFDSLLPREYSPGRDASRERRLRALWMLRVPGRLERLADASELGELGRLLAAAVARHCLPPCGPETAAFQTGDSESWL